MKNYSKTLLGAVLIVSFSLAASLWSEKSKAQFVRTQEFNVGDTITILIDESLSAAQSGTTRLDRSSDAALNFSNRAESSAEAGRRTLVDTQSNSRLNLSTTGRTNYSGTGRTERSSSIKTTITATVIDVQPNGNLFVLGQRSIRVNEEVETLEVSGIVNTEKLKDDNSISSTQIANAKITIRGAGTVSSPQQPGLLGKMFEWLF
ncbi:flagellar L-ring protein FlgH [Candidatus Termititenax persephonae]|uniref:Flagellar L-ring protein FlgH n=1 Tax=Candidatus Termititenax persephonae TaxID=2218525 RepID=A0A388TH19_9BACT|nr:flagellar L-ring protein FlgH [Candidatus Termititenax persephonae]